MIWHVSDSQYKLMHTYRMEPLLPIIMEECFFHYRVITIKRYLFLYTFSIIAGLLGL